MNEKSFEILFRIKRIIYYNPKNCYGIIISEILDSKDSTYRIHDAKIKGFFPYIFEGDIFKAQGFYENDSDGMFIQARDISYFISATEKAIEDFISSRKYRIPKKVISSLIKEFGYDLFEIISSEPELLNKVEMTPKVRDKVMKIINEGYIFPKLVALLLSIKISPNYAMHIWERYEENSVAVVRNNPYSLSSISEITFDKLDKLAKGIGMKPNSAERLKAGIKSFMDFKIKNLGDIYVTRSSIERNLSEYLKLFKVYEENISTEEISEQIKILIKEKELTLVSHKNIHGKKIEIIYRKEMLECEDFISKKLREISGVSTGVTEDKVSAILEKFPKQLDAVQKEAVIKAVTKNISVITGGPGTGKTTIIQAIIFCMKKLNPECSVATIAPTGRAGRRIQEVTGNNSSTIHRAIELDSMMSINRYFTENMIIVDESSMIDIVLFAKLLEAAGDDSQIVLIGDSSQLPPVGPGLIFKDIIDSDIISVVKLINIYRQTGDSNIIKNAQNLISSSDTQITKDNSSDFKIWDTKPDSLIKPRVIKTLDKILLEYDLKDVVILSPMKNGSSGTNSFNQAIQERFNPRKGNKYYVDAERNVEFRVGDRVIQNENDYELGVMNGEIGFITDIINDVVMAEFSDIIIVYDSGSIHEIDLAYSISVHKSQGSEFPVVIFPISENHDKMLNRNLVYTAWTRARETLICIGDIEKIEEIKHKEERQRLSLLKHKLIC